MSLKQFIDFTIFHKHRLENIKPIPLGASIASVTAMYGAPVEKEPFNEFPEAIEYVFYPGPYHNAVLYEWQDRIQSITYWSVRSDPGRDLVYMTSQYGEGIKWTVMQEGYLYQREDGNVRLWCSAIPAIGVAYTDYLSAKADYKRAQKEDSN